MELHFFNEIVLSEPILIQKGLSFENLFPKESLNFAGNKNHYLNSLNNASQNRRLDKDRN
jgi:hypothetical protein